MDKKDFLGITSVPIDEYLKHDYYQKIIEYIRGKKLLDVGCIDDGQDDVNKVRLWNHWLLFKVSKSITGIDVRVGPIKQLKQIGFNVVRMDAQNMRFKDKFEVIFAGELIEHLPNPGLFLRSAANLLDKNGLIILSTPNPFSLNRIVRVFQSLTNEPAVNPDHTMYLSPQNIRTLAKKCDLAVIRIDYAHFPFTRNNLLIILNKIGCKLIGDRFKEQMLVFIQKSYR
ncbi:MAG: methyltransferase domain-containing protein [Patescibacteria group bacterium]